MSDYKAWHGVRGKKGWKTPKRVATSEESNRADQGNKTKAHEYLDDKQVLEEKLEIVAQLIRQSKFCCAYTGAGLSRSSGIPDYATKAKDSIVKAPKLLNNLDAEPTYAHCVLTAMEAAGYLHHYVQQNHDGLPQKSGYPQHKINEIHGAWYDPSNPVVQFSGSLRGDLFDWMHQAEQETDLCLCLGTSLSGMNADRMAVTPANKSLKSPPEALGTIIINIQQTDLDPKTAIRVWAKLDDAFAILTQKLGLHNIRPNPVVLPPGDVFTVPYNAQGEKDDTVSMTWDLRKGAKIVVPVKGAMNYNKTGEVVDRRGVHYNVRIDEQPGFYNRLLGNWWVDAAIRGTVPQLPVVNINAVVVKNVAKDKEANVEQMEGLTINNNINNGSSSSNYNNNDNSSSSTKKEEIILPEFINIIQSHVSIDSNDNNQHKWGLKIDPAACGFVDNVVWKLHPTFHPPEMKCSEAPFKISRLGWGVFPVGATITLKPEYGALVLTAKHGLEFNDGGDTAKVTKVATKQ